MKRTLIVFAPVLLACLLGTSLSCRAQSAVIGLPTGGGSGTSDYNALTNKPTLGTAAAQNTSAFDASGAATTAQAASVQKSSNLSDLGSATTARTNLGLGTAATQTAASFSIGAGYQSSTFTVGTGGVTANTIVTFDATSKVIAPTTAVFGGIAASTVAAAGSVEVIRSGLATCVFDGASTIGDIVVPSSTTLGDCHDSGLTSTQSVQSTTFIVGAVQTAASGAGVTGTVRIHSPGSFGAHSTTSPLFIFQGYGDSYVLGSGAVTPSIGGGFAQLAKTLPNVPSADNGVSGANSDAINLVVWTKVQPSPQVPSAYVIDGGANDGPNCGTSTSCITDFKEEVSASIGRLTIPNQERTWGSACTQTSGTWTADNGAPYVIPAPTYYLNPGTAVSTSTSGGILTCTVTSRVASTKVGLNFQVTNAQTGTFTVSVDGSAQTDQCSGTTTFTSAPCGGLTLLTSGQTTTIFRQEFTGTSGTSHTVVITTTNAAKVDVTAVDAITPTAQVNSNYVIAFGPNAAFTNSALYDTAIGAVANQFATDGALVAFADLQSTTAPGPGVNNTTDISQTATTSCDASANANHPSDVCGYYHLAQTVVNAAKVSGWYIFGTPQSFAGLTATSGGLSAVALPTSAIAAGTCSLIPGSAWTVAGVTIASHIGWDWSGDPGGTDGQLQVVVAPTNSGTVVGRVCNPSATSITPTTQAINWWVEP